MKTSSIWRSAASGETRTAAARVLGAPTTADVAIVGAGITGITTALLLAAAGKDVIVLEASTIGAGTTGASTGNLYAPLGQGVHRLHRRWGGALAQVLRARAEAIGHIEGWVAQYRLECAFRRVPWTLYAPAGDAEGEAMIVREAEALKALGFLVRAVERPPLPFATGQAIVLDGQAQIDPWRYVQQLAAAARQQGAVIVEGVAVTTADEDEGVLETTAGRVQADAIVWATHTPKGRHLVHAELAPYREYAVAAPLPADTVLPDGIFWSAEESHLSIRRTDVGGAAQVMVLGGDHKTGQSMQDDAPYRTLEDRCRERFNVAGFTHHWSAQHYRPADGLPYIGRTPGAERSLFATGFSADGLVYGTVAATLLTALVLEREHAAAELFSPSRFTPVKSAANFVKENLNVAGQFVKGYTQAESAADLARLAPGEGCVLSEGGERLAVHRDADGHLHALSAVCPHMKCIVQWNPAEQSWDCPCHGSRFAADGSLLEGPALEALELRTLHGL